MSRRIHSTWKLALSGLLSPIPLTLAHHLPHSILATLLGAYGVIWAILSLGIAMGTNKKLYVEGQDPQQENKAIKREHKLLERQLAKAQEENKHLLAALDREIGLPEHKE